MIVTRDHGSWSGELDKTRPSDRPSPHFPFPRQLSSRSFASCTKQSTLRELSEPPTIRLHICQELHDLVGGLEPLCSSSSTCSFWTESFWLPPPLGWISAVIITHRLLRIDGCRHHLCLVAHLSLAVRLCSFRFKGSWVPVPVCLLMGSRVPSPGCFAFFTAVRHVFHPSGSVVSAPPALIRC